MGRVFLDHPGGSRVYCCANCDSALTNRSELVSTVKYIKFCLYIYMYIIIYNYIYMNNMYIYNYLFLQRFTGATGRAFLFSKVYVIVFIKCLSLIKYLCINFIFQLTTL